MITLFLSLLFIASSGQKADTCEDQASCISIEIKERSDGDIDTIDICLSHLCKADDNGEISHACPNVDGKKFDPWHDKVDPPAYNCDPDLSPATETGCMCHYNVPCDTDHVDYVGWVEFAVKDANSCGEQGSTPLDITGTIVHDNNWITTVECRVAYDDDDPNDVLCENAQHDECIHKIWYECPSEPTPADSGEGGPIPSCELQTPCLEFDITYPQYEGTVEVTVTYNSNIEGCIKDGPISYVCFDSDDADATDSEGVPLGRESKSASSEETASKVEDFQSGSTIVVTAACNSSNPMIEVAAFKDGHGDCGEFGGGEVMCRAVAEEDNFCGRGNADHCLYTVSYDADQCSYVVVPDSPPESGSIASGQQDAHTNAFGMNSVSKGEATGIYAGLALGGIALVVVIVGMIWFYVVRAKRRKVEKQMEIVEPSESVTPQGTVIVEDEVIEVDGVEEGDVKESEAIVCEETCIQIVLEE